MKWKKISSKSVYKNNWIELVEDIVQTDKGKKLLFGVVHKKPFALIIPWDGKKLTLIGQYRYSVGSFSWEFPQGHFQKNSIIATAKEELEEETGLRAKKIKKIGQINLAPGLPCTQKCCIFIATDLTEGKQNLEESELGMKIKKATVKEFVELIRKRRINDGPTIASFGLARELKLF